jgi:two-component system, chemotaxis family, protein-glutamate methylesterase/glutaminase
MAGRDIIVVGASAGGVEALSELAAGLPRDLPAAVFVVHHFPAHATSVLPSILERAGPLPAQHAVGDDRIECGRIYIAPPNYHLLIRRGRVRVTRGPRENGHRPAVDPLFRSAAVAYGPRVVGVILSGTLDDGAAGLLAIKQRGGIAIVQDPADAMYPGMPTSAIQSVEVDDVVPLSQMVATLIRVTRESLPRKEEREESREMEEEVELAELDMAAVGGEQHPGTPSTFACPECGGALWELTEADLIRFRCRVGHAYSADHLLDAQTEQLEAALWTALRALEEKASLSRRLIARSRLRGHQLSVQRFERQEQENQQRAAIIRQFLLSGDDLNPMGSTDPPPSSGAGSSASERSD